MLINNLIRTIPSKSIVFEIIVNIQNDKTTARSICLVPQNMYHKDNLMEINNQIRTISSI